MTSGYLHTPTIGYGIGYGYGAYGKRSADAEPSYGIGYRARAGGYLHTPTIGYGIGYGAYGKRSADAEPSYGYGITGPAVASVSLSQVDPGHGYGYGSVGPAAYSYGFTSHGHGYGIGKREAEPSYVVGLGLRYRTSGYLHTPTIGYGYGLYGKRSADASYGYGYLGVAGSHQVVSRPYSQYQVSQQHPY